MGALAYVAELARGSEPFAAVRSAGTGDRVRHLVQQNLVDLVVVEPRGEIL